MKDKYREETNLDVYAEHNGFTGKGSYSDKYVEWLEEQLKQVKNIAYEPVLADSVCPYCKQPTSVNNKCVNVACGNWLSKC